MKKSFYILLLCLFSCAKERIVISEPPKSEYNGRKASAELFLAIANKQPYTKNFPSNNIFSEEYPSLEEVMEKSGLMYKYRDAYASSFSTQSWATITPKIIEEIKQKNILTPKKYYTTDIQDVSLRTLRLYLLKQKSTETTIKQTIFFMDILTEHQALDVDVLADALVYIKPYISKKKYQWHLGNIKNQTLTKKKHIEQNYLQVKEAHLKAEGREKALLLNKLYNISKKSKEINHVGRVLKIRIKPLNIKRY